MTVSNVSVAVVCNSHHLRQASARLAKAIAAPLLFNILPRDLPSPEFVVVFNQDLIFVQQTGPKAPGPIYVDFLAGAVNHRRQFGGGKGQMIAKAVGVQAHVYPTVIDATAGLGKDAFVLASLGCTVNMLERSALVHALLDNGLTRAVNAATDSDVREILSRLTLEKADAQEYFSNHHQINSPHVIYLDPMFPQRQKSADVKKDMQAFHALVGKDEDADHLLGSARDLAEYRVVVKRPKKAPYLAGVKPNIEFSGKSGRFDVYTNKKMPTELI